MHRYLAVLAALLISVSSLFAQEALQRGDVVAQSVEFNHFLTHPFNPGIDLAVTDSNGIRKSAGPTELPEARSFAASPDGTRLFAVVPRGVAVWRAGESGYTEYLRGFGIFGEMVMLRSGEILVAAFDSVLLPAKLLKVNESGNIVWERRLAPPEGTSLLPFPEHMELLADECTLAWSLNRTYSDIRYTYPHRPLDFRRIRGFNLCTNERTPDVLVLPDDVTEIRAFRQLPNGDFLVATEYDVRRLTRSGTQIAVYDAIPPLETEFTISTIALTPDATGVWIARGPIVERIDFAAPDVAAARFELKHRNDTMAFAVAGEGRAALQFPRRRATRK